jgi:GntR family transcriptional regulator
MLYIDVMSRTPVYEQIIVQIEKLIGAGILKEGEQLPSVRSLSIELSVNPNTIQKAYNELDRRGVTVSVAGKGCFISKDISDVIKSAAVKRLPEFEKFAKGNSTKIKVYGSDDEVIYDPEKRVGITISDIGASNAVSLGAYLYAIDNI